MPRFEIPPDTALPLGRMPGNRATWEFGACPCCVCSALMRRPDAVETGSALWWIETAHACIRADMGEIREMTRTQLHRATTSGDGWNAASAAAHWLGDNEQHAIISDIIERGPWEDLAQLPDWARLTNPPRDGWGSRDDECDDPYCESCYGPREHEEFGPCIFDYSYTPSPLMFRHGQGAASPRPIPKTPYLGIELELEFRGYSYAEDVAEFVNGTDSEMSGYWYAKHDGSLSDGAEIVSHPGTIDAHRSEYPWAKLLAGLRGIGARADDNCGIHVHVSRDSLAPWQWARVARVLWSQRPSVERFAGRRSHWGTLDAAARGDVMDVLTKGKRMPSDRYYAMNLLPPRTVEFRLFASTTNEDMALGALECCDALVTYARRLPTADAVRGALTWSAFSSWARPLYPAFANRLISTRGI